MFDSLIITILIAFFSSLLIGLLTIKISKRLLKPARNDIKAVQSAHTVQVPRIGSLLIIFSLFLGAIFQSSEMPEANFLLKLLLSVSPVALIGLSEDLGFHMRPRVRISAAALSGAVFIIVFEEWLPRADFPGLNLAVQWAPFAMLFSIFLTVSISHAFNLIDGLNGLAAITAISSAIALATISNSVELYAHRDVLILLVAAISGFLLLNFPFARIFLGDAGSYSIGHMLSWISISILWNTEAVTPWAILLIFFWPVADTILAMVRRFSKGKAIFQPDRLHFHQLMMRGVEIMLLGRNRRMVANPLATVLMLPLIISPMCAGVLFAADSHNAALAVLAFTVLFIAAYLMGLTIANKMRNRRFLK